MVDAHQKRAEVRSFAMADNEVWRDPTLPLQVKAVYTYIAGFCSTTREAWPSRKRIAADLGISVRTVDAALRVAVDVGLIDVVHEYVTTTGARVRRTLGETLPGEQTSNRYVLHDDTYVAGKGPGGKLSQQPRSTDRGAESAPRGEHTVHPPRAEAAHEIDNRSIPAPRAPQNETTATPPGEDDCASSTLENFSRAKMKIFLPDEFKRPTDDQRGEFERYLVSAVIAALRRNGYSTAHDAGDILGRRLREERHRLRIDRLHDTVESVLDAIADGRDWQVLVDHEPPF